MFKRTKRILSFFLFLLAILFLGGSLSGCSPWYVMRAAYEESKILLRREKIDKVIADPKTSDVERGKLQLVLQARQHAMKIGLNPKESFTRYTRVNKDVLAWVLLASKDDSFELYQWWFPIVGSVPYKGYFDKSDAQKQARKLEKDGYETWIRGTEAFSTLGWFNDPVISTTLKNDDSRIVNTVIHESLHSTFWLPNHVDFNESLANFVGIQAGIEFYEELQKRCADDADCVKKAEAGLAASRKAKEIELELAEALETLHKELEDLYKSSRTREEKLAEREIVFERNIGPMRSKFPELKILKKINNAEIIQLRLYLRDLVNFDRVYQEKPGDYAAFLKEMEAIKDAVEEDSSRKPFELLRQRIDDKTDDTSPLIPPVQ